MKLINREPTEEMTLAGRTAIEEGVLCMADIFQAMFDAAPTLKVDMEPVAWMHVSRHGTHFGKVDNALRPDATLLYSAGQVATLRGAAEVLQAENERLKQQLNNKAPTRTQIAIIEENTRIGMENFRLRRQVLGQEQNIETLTAERDELLKAIQNVKDMKGRHHTELAMLAMFELLKGEKHG